MATIIALTNQKGGVGKTTSSSAIISGLAAKNKKILGIDLDPQGNLGFSLGMNAEQCDNIYHVLKGETSLKNAIQSTEICDLVGSDIMLSSLELEYKEAGRELLLKKALESVMNDYDYIVIDTPPSLNILTVNAYSASNYLIIPMAPEILSLVGVSQIKETIETVRSATNPDLQVLGILLTKFNGRTLLAQEVSEMAEQIAKQLGSRVFLSKIRPGVAVAEAPAHGESILDYAPRSNSAKDYQSLVDELCILLN